MSQIKVFFDRITDKYVVYLADSDGKTIGEYFYRSPINVGQKIQDLQAEGHTLDQALYDKAFSDALG